MSFTNIEIFPYDITVNQYGKAQYRQCQAFDRRPSTAGRFGVESVRCGADAMVIVKRTSRMTDNTYEDAMCDRHAAPWKEAIILTKKPLEAAHERDDNPPTGC